jgi:hypothetical protein
MMAAVFAQELMRPQVSLNNLVSAGLIGSTHGSSAEWPASRRIRATERRPLLQKDCMRYETDYRESQRQIFVDSLRGLLGFPPKQIEIEVETTVMKFHAFYRQTVFTNKRIIA